MRSQEDLEDALHLAVRLRNEQLTNVFEDKLACMFSGSAQLRRHRLSNLLGAQDYSGAARLFQDISTPDGRADFEYFNELARTFGGGTEPDVPSVLRLLSERFPARWNETLLTAARSAHTRGSF